MVCCCAIKYTLTNKTNLSVHLTSYCLCIMVRYFYILFPFQDNEEEPFSPMARLPKAGAYTDSSESESPEKFNSRTSLTLKVSNGKIVRYAHHFNIRNRNWNLLSVFFLKKVVNCVVGERQCMVMIVVDVKEWPHTRILGWLVGWTIGWLVGLCHKVCDMKCFCRFWRIAMKLDTHDYYQV